MSLRLLEPSPVHAAKNDNLGLDRFVALQVSKREARQELRKLALEERAKEDESAVRKKKLTDMLFDACKNKPRLIEVSFIVKRCRETVQSVNAFGQTPLHVAAANGANTNIIVYLSQKFPKACAMKDLYGRVPLHYVVRSSLWSAEGPSKGEAALYDVPDDKKYYIGPTYVDMVKVICQADPSAFSIEDAQGCNPIEYALVHDASIEVIKLLQHQSMNSLRTIQADNKTKNVSASLNGMLSSSQSTPHRRPLQKQDMNLIAGIGA